MSAAQASLRVAHAAFMAATREVQRFYEDHPAALNDADREHLGRLMLDVETMINTAIRLAARPTESPGKKARR